MVNNSKIEYIDCALCGCKESRLFDSVGEWNIVKCSNCGFCFTNPRPIISELPKFYEESYYTDSRHVAKFYNADGSVKIASEDYYNRILDIENNVDKRGRILEIGAARGGFLAKMRERGWEVYGVEISEDAVKLGKEINNVDLFCGTYEEFHSDEKFDVICMYQTLEHVPNPKEIIKKSFQDLKKGGLFIAEIPNVRCFEMRYNKKRKHLSFDLPRHLSHFSPKYLKNVLIKEGFEIVEINLYPSKNVLKFLNFLSKIKGGQKEVQQSSGNGKSGFVEIPLMKRQAGLKLKFINLTSKVFPGWRFTITGRKL